MDQMRQRDQGYIQTSVILVVLAVIGIIGAFALDSALVATAAVVAILVWALRAVVFYRVQHPKE